MALTTPQQSHPRSGPGALRVWTLLKNLVIGVLVLLPVVALHGLVSAHKVNIPFLDDWMYVHMDVKASEGTLTWRDFFMVQMEHRMAFVRGVIMLCHQFWPADYTKQMWISWGLITLTLVNVGLLLRRTAGVSFQVWWPVLVLASVTLFTPVQYRIVLWPMMFQVACPAFFLSSALVVMLTRWPLWLRFLVAMSCAQCATQSFATGILVWVLMMPMIWWSGAIEKARSRMWFFCCWLLVFAVTMGLYFHDLKNEVDPQFSYKQGEEMTMGRNFSEFFKNPGKVVAFVARFLGCHLGRGSSLSVMDASLWLGGFSLLLLTGACAYWVFRFKDETLRRRLLPWILLGGYSVGSGVLTALGRVWASQSGDNAIHARYVIHAIPLTVALIVLVWMIARDLRQRKPEWNRLSLEVLAGAALSLLVIQGISWAFGCRMMNVWESARLRGAASTLFFDTVHEAEGVIAGNRDLARQANKLGMLNPPMLKTAQLNNFSLSSKLLSPNTARLSSMALEQDEEGIFGYLTGYACVANRERVADAVLLTYKNSLDGSWVIFHVTQVGGLPLYLADLLERDLQFTLTPGTELTQEGLAGFTGKFRLSKLPQGLVPVMAWALDYKKQRVFPMMGYYQIDTVRGKIKRLGMDPKAVNLDWFIERGKGRPDWEQLK